MSGQIESITDPPIKSPTHYLDRTNDQTEFHNYHYI